MNLKKLFWSKTSLFIAIAFLIGLGSADYVGKAWRARHRLFRFGDTQTIAEYLQSHPVRKLQLGAGGDDPPGWLNSDIIPTDKEIYLDATKRYAFPDGSFQYVFSEHMIEHISWEAGVMMLRECYRVLATGGKLRIVTPNLAKFAYLLNGNPDADAQRYIEAKLRFEHRPITPIPGPYLINHEMRDFGHQFLYDPVALRKSLELAGFKQIAQYEVTQATDPVFKEVEVRTRHPDPDMRVLNNWEAMAFEAVR